MQINIEGLSSVKSDINKVKNSIRSAKNTIDGISIPNDFENAGDIRVVSSFLSSVEGQIGEVVNWIDSCTNKFKDVENKNDKILDSLGKNPLLKTLASYGNAGIAVSKGVASLGEHIVDAWAIILTGTKTVPLGASDIASWAAKKVSGKDSKFEWKNTKKVWEKTMSFVSKEYVGNAYNKFYNTSIGKTINDNAYKPFKNNGVVTNAISGLTEIAGIVAITLLSGGAAGVAAGSTASAGISAGVAGTVGFGKYTEEGWNKLSKAKEKISFGKKTFKALGYGVFNAAWESAQWFVGGMLGNVVKGTKGIASATRVGIDSVFNAADTPIRALSESILTGESFKKAWKEQGAWSSLLINLGIGFFGSAFGEAINIKSSVKEIDKISDLVKIINTGDESDQRVVSMLKATLEDLREKDSSYVEKLCDKLIELKRVNPEMAWRISDNGGSFWNHNLKKLFLGENQVKWGCSGTLEHETGHLLFYMVLHEKLPDNWQNITINSRILSSTKNNRLFNETIQEINKHNQLSYNKAYSNFEKSLKNAGYKSINDYIENYSRSIESQLNKNSLKDTINLLRKAGYNEKTIEMIVNQKFSVSPREIVTQYVWNEINTESDRISRIEYGEDCAVSDIIDAIYHGWKKDIYGNPLKLTYQHERKYYQEKDRFYIKQGYEQGYGESLAAFHEIIANFTNLKLSGNTKALEDLKNIFGKEFYLTLEDTFNKFFE